MSACYTGSAIRQNVVIIINPLPNRIYHPLTYLLNSFCCEDCELTNLKRISHMPGKYAAFN